MKHTCRTHTPANCLNFRETMFKPFAIQCKRQIVIILIEVVGEGEGESEPLSFFVAAIVKYLPMTFSSCDTSHSISIFRRHTHTHRRHDATPQWQPVLSVIETMKNFSKALPWLRRFFYSPQHH